MRFSPFSFFGLEENPPLKVEYLIVAGGGAGGTADNSVLSAAGGGGAGGFISGSFLYTGSASTGGTPITYSISVGLPGGNQNTLGVRGDNGQNSTAFGYTAIGGGGGGGSTTRNGNSGGSGGGGGFLGDFSGGSGGSGTTSQGFAGAAAVKQTGTPFVASAGAGGGAQSAAIAGPSRASGSSAGEPKAWLDGIRYAGGGCSTQDSKPRYCYGEFTGSGGSSNSDAGGNSAGQGGVVALRYSSSIQHFTGSNTTFESGGYWYHYMYPSASSYNLVYLGNYPQYGPIE